MKNLRFWVFFVLGLFGALGGTTSALGQEETDEKKPKKNRFGVEANGELPGRMKVTDVPKRVVIESVEASRNYVHNWEKLPILSGPLLNGAGDWTHVPQKGELTVAVFLASWDEASQQIVDGVRKLEKRFEPLFTNFIYVFAHDTRDDAEGFMKEFGIAKGILATEQTYHAFNNPELPTIYVSDRQTWLAKRYSSARKKDIAHLKDYLRHVTSY